MSLFRKKVPKDPLEFMAAFDDETIGKVVKEGTLLVHFYQQNKAFIDALIKTLMNQGVTFFIKIVTMNDDEREAFFKSYIAESAQWERATRIVQKMIDEAKTQLATENV